MAGVCLSPGPPRLLLPPGCPTSMSQPAFVSPVLLISHIDPVLFTFSLAAEPRMHPSDYTTQRYKVKESSFQVLLVTALLPQDRRRGQESIPIETGVGVYPGQVPSPLQSNTHTKQAHLQCIWTLGV